MLYQITQIDPITGKRLDTFDDEMTEAQLDAYLANALEVSTDKNGGNIYRFAEGWMQYLAIAN